MNVSLFIGNDGSVCVCVVYVFFGCSSFVLWFLFLLFFLFLLVFFSFKNFGDINLYTFLKILTWTN